MNNEIKKEYSTSDISLASYLKCLKYEILDIKKEGSKLTLIFKDKENRKKDTLDFFNNSGTVEPNLFAKAMHDLKGLIHNID